MLALLKKTPRCLRQPGSGSSGVPRLLSAAWLKGILGLFLLESIRGLERLVPLPVLYWLLYPYAYTRNLWSRRPNARRNPTHVYLNSVLEFFPDRLSSAHWRERCPVIGLDRLRQARQRGRPVVLAFWHFGPFTLIGWWLRSHGFPVTALSYGKTQAGPRLQRRRDRYVPLPAIPTVLYLDHLKEVVGVLSTGGILGVALDFPSGRQLEIPMGEGLTFRMATGALRLAARHGAELIPCNIINVGPWRFRIELGQPVPKDYLTRNSDLLAAGKHLVTESLPHWRLHPEQCSPHLLRRLQPILALPQ